MAGMLRTFLSDERGAITVDWVAVTAATVGLGLATVAVVSPGIETLSGDVSDQLSGTEVALPFTVLRTLFETDFAAGAAGWIGGTPINLAGFGDVLQIGPGITALMQVDVPPGAGAATVVFDLIAADAMNNDPASVWINGHEVAIYQDNHGQVTASTPGGPGITVAVDQHYTNSPVGAGTHGHDSRVTFTISVDDPGDTLTLGVQSGADEGVDDEFYAIDDVMVQTG